MEPALSVVVPTRDRAGYLEVALASLARQDADDRTEVLAVDDGSTDATPQVAERAGARYLRQPLAAGPNAARNAGIRAARAQLVALIDDDVYVPPHWLGALLEGAARYPDVDVFGGPIRARLEGRAPRGCGRERPPITTLDLGPDDRETALVWSANMALRPRAMERAGPFNESLPPGGDEEEWLARLRAAGGRVMYLAAAGLEHRRAEGDAGLRPLMRGAYLRGRNTRAYERRRGDPPSLPRELRVLAGCGWHLVRRACPQGLVMGAHAAGRTVEAVRGR